MKAIGVIDARVSLMRHANRIGELDPALAATLDDYVDNWRTEPHIGRWWETFDDLSEWIADNGRAPTPSDPHSAGLSPWLAVQDSVGLMSAQLQALLSLSVFPTELTSELWSVIGVLHSRGVVASRPDDRLVIDSLVARSGASVVSVAPVEVFEPQLLSYLLFVARTGRQPAAHEPSGRWIRARRTDSVLPAGLVAVLNTVPDWEGDNTVGELFSSRYARWVAASNRAGHKPNVRSNNVEERACARWAVRVRRSVRDGRLSAAEVIVAELIFV